MNIECTLTFTGKQIDTEGIFIDASFSCALILSGGQGVNSFDYNNAINKPSINGHTLSGSSTLAQIGAAAASHDHSSMMHLAGEESATGRKTFGNGMVVGNGTSSIILEINTDGKLKAGSKILSNAVESDDFSKIEAVSALPSTQENDVLYIVFPSLSGA